jgi:hypothetical protein
LAMGEGYHPTGEGLGAQEAEMIPLRGLHISES